MVLRTFPANDTMVSMRILIADDQEIFRGGLRQLLAEAFDGAEIVETAAGTDALSRLAGSHSFDLIIAETGNTPVHRNDFLAALCRVAGDAKLVVMSDRHHDAAILEMLADGVDGYIPKVFSAGAAIAALQQVLSGKTFVPGPLRETHGGRRQCSADSGWEFLTRREREVLTQLMHGKTSKEIGRTLGMAEATVKIHLASIYRALGVHNRCAAIAKLAAATH